MIEPISRRRAGLLSRWLPVVLWGSLIFVFSGELFSGANTAGVIAPWLGWMYPNWSVANIEHAHYLLRKLGHLGEYFIFALLLMRALHGQVRNAPQWKRIFRAVALTALYAASDELHQAFVPSRSAGALDVLIDVCGGIGGVLCYCTLGWRKSPLGERCRECL